MSYSTEAQYIESRFETNWGSTTPIKWDNVEYSPESGTNWVEVRIFNGTATPVSLGSSMRHRITGVISINIYTPLNEGTRTARDLCDTAAAIFRNTTFNNIHCYGAKIRRIGDIQNWFIHNVSIPFYRDEIFNV